MKRVFLTVGTQCPFPRLVNAISEWSGRRDDVEVIAQTCDTTSSPHLRCSPTFEPDEFRQAIAGADLIVGHAGIGTIVSALEHDKPVLVIARRSYLGEHRNEHQLATVNRFRGVGGVYVADEVETLPSVLDSLLESQEATQVVIPPPHELCRLIQRELTPEKVLLLIASGGGHWIELARLLSALDHPCVVCATTALGDAGLAGVRLVYRVQDGNRWDKLALLRSGWDVLRLVWRVRPDVILTTGAAPGYFAMRAGKLLGARTIWIDSIANAEELSLAGQKARRFADVWLTQWPELARPGGPAYAGSVLPIFGSSQADASAGSGAGQHGEG